VQTVKFNNFSAKKIAVIFVSAVILTTSCSSKNKEPLDSNKVIEKVKFGYNFNNYHVIQDTIRSGENFGEILSRYNVDYSKIYNIVNSTKDTFDIRQLRAGKPYTLLCSKDETHQPLSFISAQ
jgi:murein DD-endopeptidase